MNDIKKVAIVTPEYYGDTMVGGLAVSVHGLAHALKKKGIEVSVVMPAYQQRQDSNKFTSEPFLSSSGLFNDVVLNSYSKDGVNIHKVVGLNLCQLVGYTGYPECPNILDSVYRESQRKSFEGWHLFSATLPYVLNKAGLKDVDVIHLMEWTTAAASYFLRTRDYNQKGILITSHNLNYIGEVPDELDEHKSSFDKGSQLRDMRVSCLKDYQGNLFGSLLELGIYYANAVNTVSPSEATEVLNRRKGVNPRLIKALKQKGLGGILNGIDPTIIAPEIDHRIERYHTKTYESIARGKKDNKIKLHEELSKKRTDFKINPDKMLISMMCRLAEQKSIYEVLETSKALKELDLQLLIVGEPASPMVRTTISNYHNSENFFIHESFVGPQLQHRILAASDAILQASKWEPCGYTQLEGMAYGAIPIVTNVGGHKDTVKSFDGENGYGFLIDEPTTPKILEAMKSAVDLFKNKEKWKIAVMNAVNEDFSWDGKGDSVGKYLELYEQVIAKRGG